jgi:hypothetical protein
MQTLTGANWAGWGTVVATSNTASFTWMRNVHVQFQTHNSVFLCLTSATTVQNSEMHLHFIVVTHTFQDTWAAPHCTINVTYIYHKGWHRIQCYFPLFLVQSVNKIVAQQFHFRSPYTYVTFYCEHTNLQLHRKWIKVSFLNVSHFGMFISVSCWLIPHCYVAKR